MCLAASETFETFILGFVSETFNKMLLIAKIRDNFLYSIHLKKKDFKILLPLPEFSTMKNTFFFLEMTPG